MTFRALLIGFTSLAIGFAAPAFAEPPAAPAAPLVTASVEPAVKKPAAVKKKPKPAKAVAKAAKKPAKAPVVVEEEKPVGLFGALFGSSKSPTQKAATAKAEADAAKKVAVAKAAAAKKLGTKEAKAEADKAKKIAAEKKAIAAKAEAESVKFAAAKAKKLADGKAALAAEKAKIAEAKAAKGKAKTDTAKADADEAGTQVASAESGNFSFGLFSKPVSKSETPSNLETLALDDALRAQDAKKKFKVKKEFEPALVPFPGNYKAGTIVVVTAERRLYLVEGFGRARRYAIAVGKEGLQFTGKGVVGDKQEWPRWIPTAEMIERDPKKYAQYADGMDGGPANPLGARAIYLYQGNTDTHIRAHGTIAPNSVGSASSNGCFRMINEHVIDLYGRVKMGAEFIVL
ncbi:MAG: L,D-transpeptidase [Rhizobiaceae bacterium]